MLSCCSDVETIRRRHPFVEAMFKAAEDGSKHAELERLHRDKGFPSWLSVTTAPRGTYRETDIIQLLKRHLQDRELPDRRWELFWADDFSAHKTENVKALAFERGYIWMFFGGGVTPSFQPCDLEVCQPVRRRYGELETLRQIENLLHLRNRSVPFNAARTPFFPRTDALFVTGEADLV